MSVKKFSINSDFPIKSCIRHQQLMQQPDLAFHTKSVEVGKNAELYPEPGIFLA
jgi:hypothetical protein